MNNTYKRVEVETEYGETLLLVNYSTYKNPALEFNCMHLTPLGEIIWVEYPDQAIDRVLPEYQQEFKNLLHILEKNKQDIYNNPDKTLNLEGYTIKTIGIPNDYQYNKGGI